MDRFTGYFGFRNQWDWADGLVLREVLEWCLGVVALLTEELGEMVTPFINREKTLEEDLEGRLWLRHGHVETSSDGYKGLEIREVWLETSWVMGKGRWTRGKLEAEDWALINVIYWLRKGGTPNGKWLERPERQQETLTSQKLTSPMPLSSQVQNQNLYPKPIHTHIVHYFELEPPH